jgi:hypothetical protein
MKKVITTICFHNNLNLLIKYRSPKDSPNDDEDEYFNYLVDKSVSVAANVCSSTSSDDEPDYKEEQYALCAKRTLEYYNNDDNNKVFASFKFNV